MIKAAYATGAAYIASGTKGLKLPQPAVAKWPLKKEGLGYRHAHNAHTVSILGGKNVTSNF